MSIAIHKYDVVIDVYSKLETNLITLFSGAKYKVSYRKWYTKAFYNYTYERLDAVESEHGLAIENRLMLLKPLISEKITNVKPKIFLKDSEINNAKNLLKSHQVDPEKPLIMFGILGSETYKTYPLEGMAKIIDFTVAKTKGTIIFNYVPFQKDLALEVYNYCNEETKKHIYDRFYRADKSRNTEGFGLGLSLVHKIIELHKGTIRVQSELGVGSIFTLSLPSDKSSQ